MLNPSEWPSGEIRELDTKMISVYAVYEMSYLTCLPPRPLFFDCSVCGTRRRSPHDDPGFLRHFDPPADCTIAGFPCVNPPVPLSERSETAPSQFYYIPGSFVWTRNPDPDNEEGPRDPLLFAIVEPCPDGNSTFIRPTDASLPSDECSYWITLIDHELEEYRGGFVLGSQLIPGYARPPGATLEGNIDMLDWSISKRLETFSFTALFGGRHAQTIHGMIFGRPAVVPPTPEQAMQEARDIAERAAGQQQQGAAGQQQQGAAGQQQQGAPGQQQQGAPGQQQQGAPGQQQQVAPAQQRRERILPSWLTSHVRVLSPNYVTYEGIERYELRKRFLIGDQLFDCAICGARRQAQFYDPGNFELRQTLTCADARGKPSCDDPPQPRPTTSEYYYVPGTLVWYLDSLNRRWAAMVEDPPDGAMSYRLPGRFPHHQSVYYITLIGPEDWFFAGGFALSRQLCYIGTQLTEDEMSRVAYPENARQALFNLNDTLINRLVAFSMIPRVLRWRRENFPIPGRLAGTTREELTRPYGLEPQHNRPGFLLRTPGLRPVLPTPSAGRPGDIPAAPGVRPEYFPAPPVTRPGGTPGTSVARPGGTPGSSGVRPEDIPGSSGVRPEDIPGSSGVRPEDIPGSSGVRTREESESEEEARDGEQKQPPTKRQRGADT